jgi:hypothetical protein
MKFALWAIHDLSDHKQNLDEIIKEGLASRAIACLAHPKMSAVVPALKIITNITAGTDAQIEVCFSCNYLTVVATVCSWHLTTFASLINATKQNCPETNLPYNKQYYCWSPTTYPTFF